MNTQNNAANNWRQSIVNINSAFARIEVRQECMLSILKQSKMKGKENVAPYVPVEDKVAYGKGLNAAIVLKKKKNNENSPPLKV